MVKYMIGKIIKKEKEFVSYNDLIDEGIKIYYKHKRNIDKNKLREELILILINTFNIDKAEFFSNLNSKKFNLKNNHQIKKQYIIYLKNIKKRIENIPIQYIFNKAFFYGREFYVNKNVLIPRFDTEILVKQVIDYINSNEKKKYNILDLCTGSGIILITLVKEIVDNIKNIIGIDISDKALTVSKRNILKHKINDYNVFLLKSDLFKKLKYFIKRHNVDLFDIIVSNPPYINSEDYKKLDVEVKKYEPKLALFGGKDGLEFYRRILRDAKPFLKKDGKIFLEIGYDEAKAVCEIAKKNNYKSCKVINDFNNTNRVVEISL